MKFRENSINNKFYAFALAAVFAVALAGCGGGGGGSTTTDPDPTPMPDPAIAQRAAIKSAIDMASTAVAAVDNDSSDAVVTAADNAVAQARGAITAATDVPAEEKAANTGTVDALATVLASAKMARMTALEEKEEMEQEAMVDMAAKLFAGIVPRSGDTTSGSAGTTDRFARWDTDGNIEVGDGGAGTTIINLYEDNTATVAALHGWQGKRFAVADDHVENDTDSSYEAVVYSKVGDPMMGKKFGGAAANDEFEYALTEGATAALDTSAPAVQRRIASSMFDQSAGVKEFPLPDPNPGRATVVNIPGMYHGVSGNYRCTPTAGNTCAVSKAPGGFQLGLTADATNAFTAGTEWVFVPTDPNARVTEMPDTVYASYGWWLRTDEDGKVTASAFAQPRGGPTPAAAVADTLVGSATYVGGAAGKYAISSPAGGTNEGGHFTATATLEATFGTVGNDGSTRAHTLTGTIDDFKVGDDGAARDWSVSLGRDSADSNLSATGAVIRDNGLNQTQWTIGDEAAAKSGEWQAQMYEQGADGVPTIVTGTFYTEYGNAGKMVGGFGADKQ